MSVQVIVKVEDGIVCGVETNGCEDIQVIVLDYDVEGNAMDEMVAVVPEQGSSPRPALASCFDGKTITQESMRDIEEAVANKVTLEQALGE